MPQDLKSELLLYWIQYRELEEKGGPEQDGDLFEEVLGLEEEILKSFGLPPAQKYTGIMWKLANKKSCTPKAVQKTIGKLQQAAERYYGKGVEPSLRTLKKAVKKKEVAANILPELGFLTHIYTMFLYEDLLLQKKATPEAVLQELEQLKENDLYGPVAILQKNLKPGFRRTKAYKELKAHLHFLDAFLEPESFNPESGTTHTPGSTRRPEMEAGKNIAKRENGSPEPAKPYSPENEELLGFLEIEEIIFDKDSGVTVNGKYAEGARLQPIGLGFEFDELYRLLSAYDKKNTGILSYFNKTRQRQSFDSPTIINLREKTGKNLVLNRHYLQVYKPEALNREGRPEKMTESFYLVRNILDKKAYDAKQKQHLPGQLNGWFGHLKNWYGSYLHAKATGVPEPEARQKTGLENDHLFGLARLLYLLEKHGGDARIKEQR